MTRTPLPQRRQCETLSYRVGNLTYHATIGYYADGRLGEIFLNAGKIGAEADVVARDSAIAVSFALQHGCSVEMIRAAFMRDENGEAEGPLGVLFDMLASRPRAVEVRA